MARDLPTEGREISWRQRDAGPDTPRVHSLPQRGVWSSDDWQEALVQHVRANAALQPTGAEFAWAEEYRRTAVMDCFIYESDDFKKGLQKSAHHSGEISFLRSIARPGMRAMEVGANTGVTAVVIAKNIAETGHLYAFEPVPEYYTKLMDNLSRNGANNVSAYRLALSNQTGRIRFYKREGGGSGITPATGGETLWVEATTVTEFLIVQNIDRIDLLNLDCEGSELLVLEGAKAVLEKHAPQIFCEIHHGYLNELGQSADDVIGYLRQFGYEVRMLRVEDRGAEATADTCSHIYAAKPAAPGGT